MVITSAHLRIHGRVQGVSYRKWAQREASKRNLTGWVRNLSDGSVEAVFQGPAEAVEDMLTACHRGPLMAKVSRMERVEAADTLAMQGFEVRETV